MKLFAVTVVVAMLFLHSSADPNVVYISQSANHFAAQLYQRVAKTPGNVLVCPLSAHIALALVQQGAGGATRREMANVLHLDESNNDIKNSYKYLLMGLQDNFLKIATKMFPDTHFKTKPEYISVAEEYFLSGVQPLDYSKPNDAATVINNFVENRTNHKIHDIVSPDSLTDSTKLVVVNAVHFKAGWARTFPPPHKGDFKVTPTQIVKTEFLTQTDYFPFKEDPVLGAKVLKMEYEDGKYSMVFVLPNKEDGLAELETKLAATSMDSVLSSLNEVRVEVTIPKFKIEQEINLKDVLLEMGVKQLFDSRANLSDIAEGENLYVDKVIQKTFIDVNENGTEAAAVTAIQIALLSAIEYIGPKPEVFRADHPFFFYLITSKPDTTLFSGRITKP